jgi:membrane-bound lytic murein transglycosylase A
MKRISLIIALISSFTFAGGKLYKTPTRLANSQNIFFADDLNFKHLSKAVERQLLRFKQLKSSAVRIQLGNDVYTIRDLERTLTELLKISKNYTNCKSLLCTYEFTREIRENFKVYRPSLSKNDSGYNRSDFALYTSYYSPDFDGSFVKSKEFKNAIYSMPANSRLKSSTRVSIDFDGALGDKGLELFYVKQPLFDIYLLHIEGGGRVKVLQPDNSIKYYYLSYAGSNQQRLTYIYKYMNERGYLIDDFSIKAQRDFLHNNSHLQREVFATSPSYIYFKVTEDEPLGVENIPLTEKRSAAVDRRHYGLAGLLMFVQATAPTDKVMPELFEKEESKPFSRFFLAQDTGGAIKGKARVDLYSGYGPDAELWANYLKSHGKLYFLIHKK